MPKVNVYEPTRQSINVETGEAMKVRPGRVSVGWSPDRYVQISVGRVATDGGPIMTLEEAAALASKQTGQSIPVSAVTLAQSRPIGEIEEGQEWLTSDWIELDRSTINQLIRVLREARLAVFGRDE